MKATVTQTEAAQRLHVHPNTIGNMLSDGRLEAVIVGMPGGPRQPVRRVAADSLADCEDEMLGPIARCASCHRHVSREEARQRVFNRLSCACGGKLTPLL